MHIFLYFALSFSSLLIIIHLFIPVFSFYMFILLCFSNVAEVFIEFIFETCMHFRTSVNAIESFSGQHLLRLKPKSFSGFQGLSPGASASPGKDVCDSFDCSLASEISSSFCSLFHHRLSDILFYNMKILLYFFN